MRNTVLALAFLCGGLLGAAGCAAVVFFGMFYGLRFVCWIAKSDDYMFFMWFGMIIVPAAALAALVFGGYLAVALLKKRLDPKARRGFEAVAHSAARDAG